MNEIHPATKALGHLLWPRQTNAINDPSGKGTDSLRVARWAAGVVTVVLTVVQLTVWGMIGVLSSFDSPWWLWSTIPAIGITTALSWAISARDQLGVREGVSPR